MNGHTVRVRMDETNGASPTLNVDGLGAKSIVKVPGTAVPTGSMVANAIFDLVYDNANSCWIVVGPPMGALSAPAGTKMVFNQTAAPTGWTKDSNHDNKALRLVNGTVGTGGSTAFTTVFGSRTIAKANLPTDTLSVTGTVSITVGGAGAIAPSSGASTTAVSGGAGFAFYNNLQYGAIDAAFSSGVTAALGSGTAIDFAVQYVDVIIATKD
jgi:hypothetical protein